MKQNAKSANAQGADNVKIFFQNIKLHLNELFRAGTPVKPSLRTLLILVSIIATPITLAGCVAGYIYGFNKTMRHKRETPRLTHLSPVMKLAVISGGVLIWLVLFITLKLLILIIGPEILRFRFITMFFLLNLLLSIPVFVMFRRWRMSLYELTMKMRSMGSAMQAGKEIIEQYSHGKGIYIGGGMVFPEKSHGVVTGGSRSGKGKFFVMPNALQAFGYSGSMVICDPRGEICSVTKRHLEEAGKRVVILNPWNILNNLIAGNATYNPMVLLGEKDDPMLIEDIALIAELIVPIKPSSHDEFWTNSARNIVSTLLLYIAVTKEKKDRDLTMLWEYARKANNEWDEMLLDMSKNEDPVYGRNLRVAANEIAAMMATPETFGSIMANVFEQTNFMKSNAVQKSVTSGFDPYTLSDGNTVVFLVCPIEQMKAQPQWVRLVITTMMRCVTRKHNKRVTFLIDEASTLGYISEFETCFAAYASFEISLFPIFQDLNQIQAAYGDAWQTVMANCAVKISVGARDLFTAKYFSDLAGETTNVLYRRDWMGTVRDIETNHRMLFTPDEIMRQENDMFVFIKEHPVAVVPKIAYYDMPHLKNSDGSRKYDDNPYIPNSL